MENTDLSPLRKIKPTQGDPRSNGPSRVLKSFAEHTDAAILTVETAYLAPSNRYLLASFQIRRLVYSIKNPTG